MKMFRAALAVVLTLATFALVVWLSEWLLQQLSTSPERSQTIRYVAWAVPLVVSLVLLFRHRRSGERDN